MVVSEDKWMIVWEECSVEEASTVEMMEKDELEGTMG